MISLWFPGDSLHGQTSPENLPDSNHKVNRLLATADSLRVTVRYDSSLVLFEEIIDEIGKRPELPPADLARVYSALGSYYLDRGEYRRCRVCWDSALVIRRELFNLRDLDMANILVKLGILDFELAQYESGMDYLRQARDILENDYPGQTMTADCYIALTQYYSKENKFDDAESLVKKASVIYESDPESRLQGIADCDNQHAIIYFRKGMYDSSEVMFNNALGTYIELYGEVHPLAADIFDGLASVYVAQGKFEKAKSYYARAIEIMQKISGGKHLHLAISLNNLANTYWMIGEYAQIEPLLKQAINVLESGVGPSHPQVGAITSCLAALYFAMGRLNDADSLFQQALQIEEKEYGPYHPHVATILNNLGYINTRLGEYDRAEGYLLRSIEARKNSLGRNHPDVAKSLDAISLLLEKRGKYMEAEPYLGEALRIKRLALGDVHPDVAKTLFNLGELYIALDRKEEAIDTIKQSLEIWDKTIHPIHLNVSTTVEHLGRLYASVGNYPESMKYFKRFMELAVQLTEYAFSYSSEAQKLRWVRQYPVLNEAFLTMALNHDDRKSRELALEMILKGKAIVIDALMAERKTAFFSEDDEVIKKINQRSELCTAIANMVLSGSRGMASKTYNDSVQFLIDLQNVLEADLSRQCSAFKSEILSRRFSIDDIAACLADGSVLWEFLKYHPYDFSSMKGDDSNAEGTRYLALTLNREGQISIMDLGPASEIDSLIIELRKIVYSSEARIYSPMAARSEKKLMEVAGRLYNLLFAPLTKILNGETDIYISTDAMLSLLPFEILPDFDGNYVIEKYRISYLSSGRDLLNCMDKPGPAEFAVIFADPDFNVVSISSNKGIDVDADSAAAAAPNSTGFRGAAECLNNAFTLLRYSRDEAISISQTLSQSGNLVVREYFGRDATEESLKKLSTAPKILHIATHGYFCEGGDSLENNELNNPLLRSGLAFAGANEIINNMEKISSADEDGILTALEASGLSLFGTDLVALSACETGIGELVSGEGVFGLRRAIQHAGARTILMSLWKVPDKETAELMDGFYKRWLSGKSKLDSFRESAISILKKSREERGHGHPLLWGGFVLIGCPD